MIVCDILQGIENTYMLAKYMLKITKLYYMYKVVIEIMHASERNNIKFSRSLYN